MFSSVCFSPWVIRKARPRRLPEPDSWFFFGRNLRNSFEQCSLKTRLVALWKAADYFLPLFFLGWILSEAMTNQDSYPLLRWGGPGKKNPKDWYFIFGFFSWFP